MEVIADNTVLTNFALIEGETILFNVFGSGLFTSEEVMKELREGEKKGLVPKREWSGLKSLAIESADEKRTFELLRLRLGKGESACLTIAIHRNLKVLTDDLDARRFAQRRGIPVSGTVGVLVLAVKTKSLTLQEGNRFMSELIGHGFYSPYKSLEKLI